MPTFCDVALPVPIEQVFTYRIAENQSPVIGGRVLVPFGPRKMVGVVTALHDNAPNLPAKSIKNVLTVMDASPLLDETLRKLALWTAEYYLAPLGEVFRSMLPLSAEFKQSWAYRITEAGHNALFESAGIGSSLRSRLTPEEQDKEYEVLDYLANSDAVRESTLRSSTGTSLNILTSLVRKKWISRADDSEIRDAARTMRVAVLDNAAPSGSGDAPRLNHNQQTVMLALTASGGRMPVDELNKLAIPRSTPQTLVKRGLIRIEDEARAFHLVNARKLPQAVFELNVEQKCAVDHTLRAVADKQFSVTLLHGVTGSGKTACYLSAMRRVLEDGGSAIMLVPEIGLTPAAAAHLHAVFGEEVALLHSGLSDKERAEQWRRIHRGEAHIVVGTRSAVFAPVRGLALIVVDEEQDGSYKQEETPRYNARDLAVMRGKLSRAAVVLGSATPSLESFHNASNGKYKLINLTERVEQRGLPEVEVVDMREEFLSAGSEVLFSRALLEETGTRLARGEQAILLMNRRGYSSVVLCRACGETVQCRNCALAMTHHKGSPRLECHFCGYRCRVPEECPKCQSDHIFFLGSGSEKVEDRLHAAFPTARIGRMDRDTIRGRHDFERMLDRLNSGEIDLLVGTQMVAKGHDIHGVTLVGVVGADHALSFPDFRSAERTFQLLTQVAGRAGRGTTPGRVILQTWHPDHYAIQFAKQHDFTGFAQKELQFRRWMNYPPFTSLANVLLRGEKLELVLRWVGKLEQWVKHTTLDGVRSLGPASAPLSKLKNDYRYHFVMRGPRTKLHVALRAMLLAAEKYEIPRTNMIVDMDAQSLL